MKIILVTSSFFLNGGGISSYAHDFLDSLKNKMKFVIITGDNYIKKESDQFVLYNIDLTDLSVNNARLFLNIIKKEDPDIVVNSNAMLLSCVAPFLENRINLVSISHFVNGCLADIAAYNFKYVNAIISLSNYGRLYIEKENRITNSNKIVTIYNYLRPKYSKELLNKKSNRSILKLVYPGGGSFHKSPDFVLQLLKKLLMTNLEFEFYWLGSTLLTGHRFRLVKVKDIRMIVPIDNRVIFTGMISRTEAMDIIEDANIFILPSRGEGCPISLLEAMRVGTIPIVSDSKHASREIIQDEISGYICSLNNVDCIYERIVDIINNHDQYLNIYINSNLRFLDLLREDVWASNMNNILYNQLTFVTRKPFSNLHYWSGVFDLNIILFFDRIKELLIRLKYMCVFNFHINSLFKYK